MSQYQPDEKDVVMAAIPVNLVFEVNLPGQPEDGSNVRIVRLKCGNPLSEIASAGFLNSLIKSQGIAMYTSDFVFVAGSDGNQIYKPVIGAGGVVTLTVLP
jgi:hypothetical protein